ELRLNGFGSSPTLLIDPNLLEDTKRRLLVSLFFMNGAIFAISGIFGYFLAGITLNPIKEMVDEQNRFISDASHEINTPLTSLKLAMEVFLRKKNPKLGESKILIKESIGEVDKLQSLNQSLLRLAKFEVPNGHSDYELVDIKEIADNTISKVNPMARQKNIKINNFVESQKIMGNKYALGELFVVLLDNAIKYGNKNGSVWIVSTRKKDKVEISVKDNGIGISEKDMSHIFDRFYRADLARTKTEVNGYGLGLSIAKKIVEMHHGNISVESKVNEGSTFKVLLPI